MELFHERVLSYLFFFSSGMLINISQVRDYFYLVLLHEDKVTKETTAPYGF